MLHTPEVAFAERHVESGGFRLRYLEAGQGQPVVWLHGPGGLHLSAGHHLLAATNRVIAIEGHETSPTMAKTLAQVMRAIGLEQYTVWGTASGARIALWLALEVPQAIEKVVLEAPMAILPEGQSGRDAELERRMPEIEAPTLVLIGTRDGVVAPEWGRNYMRLLKTCNFLLVYDAAHEIASDRPEAFVATVRDFLQRGDAFVVGQRSTVIYP
jgi:pimeloyl-ACP methyl ester carboxylesterase